MAQKNSIQFSIDFKTGDTKALQELKNDLAKIQQAASKNEFNSSVDEINKIINAARTLESALNQAFDVNLNAVNVQKFNQILRQSGISAETLYKDLSMAGETGQQAFLKMSSQLMQFNTAVKQSNAFLNGLAETFFNTIKWSAMSSIVNNITGTIQKSFYYIKDLDRGLNDIRVVTGKSADEMERFAVVANDAAKSLSVSTEDFTKGALIYFQQGLDEETSTRLAEITAKTANVTGQGMDAVSEELTAVWNGYQVANQAAEEGMQVYEEYVDKMAAVGATTASDLEELSTAMSKVASAASSMGVNFDDLNAQIATIVSVTRQAPESVGTALKTIYARLGDLKIDGVDEFGVKLGEVSQQLQDIGINVLDQNGNLRDMSDVIREVAVAWDGQTDAQRQAAAVAMAGKRQYNNLIALFDNQEMHEEALATSINAVGTLNKQQAIAAESLAKKMEKMSATAEDLYNNLFDEDSLIKLVESGTKALQLLADFTESVGGLKTMLPMLGSLGLQVFNEQIGRGLANIVINAQTANRELITMEESQRALQAMFSDSNFVAAKGIDDAALKQNLQELYSYYQQMVPYQSIMTKEQKEQYNNILNMKVAAGDLAISLEKQAEYYVSNTKHMSFINSNIIEELENTEAVSAELNKQNQLIDIIEENLYGTEDPISSIIENLYEVSGKLKLDEDTLDEIITRIESAANATGDVRAGAQQVVNDIKKIRDGLSEMSAQKSKITSLEESAKTLGINLRDAASAALNFSQITKTLGTIGQFASSISTISHITEIFNDNDLSAGDKFVQILMNASFAAMGLLPALSSVTKAMFNLNTQENVNIATEKAKAAADKLKAANLAAEAAQKEYLNKVTEKNTAVNVSNTEAVELQRAATQAGFAADTAAIAAKNAETEALVANNSVAVQNILASEGNVIAKIKAIAAVKLHKTAVDEDTAALVKQKAASLMVGGAIGVLITVLAACALVYKKHQEEIINTAKAEIEKTKATQEEIRANQELYDNYNKTLKAYEEGTASKEDLLKSTESICEAYDIEINKLDILNEKYDNITAAINKKREAELKEAQDNLKQQAQNQATTTFGTAREGRGSSAPLSDKYNVNFNKAVSFTDSYDYNLGKLFEKNVNQDFLSKNLLGVNNSSFTIESGNMEQMLELYDQLSASAKEYIDLYGQQAASQSTEFQALEEQLNRVGPEVEEYRNTINELQESEAMSEILNTDFSDVDTLDEYNKKLIDIRQALYQSGMDADRAAELAEQYASEVNDTTKALQEEKDITEAIAEKTKMGLEDVQSQQENLPEDQKKLILSGQIDFDYVFDEDDIEKRIQLAMDQAKLKTFDVGQMSGIASTLVSGKKLTKNDNEALSSIAAENPSAMAGLDNKSVIHQFEVIDEITQYQIQKNEEYLENTKEVLEEKIKIEKEAQEEIFESEEEYNQAVKKLNEEELSDEEREQLQEKVDAYTNLQLIIEDLQEKAEKGLSFGEIEDIGFSSLVTNLDLVETKLDTIKSAAELVGEGFTVAASDVEKFSEMFPEMLEGMEILSDGSMKLSQETVQNNIEGIKAEFEARTQAKIAEVDQQIQLKELEQEYLQEKLNALTDYLDGVGTEQDLEDKIYAAGQKYRSGLMDITGEDIEELTNFSIDSSQTEGKAIISMLDQVGLGFSKAAAAHYAMIEGKEYDWKKISFSGTASSAGEYASNKGDAARDRLNAITEESYAAIYAEAQEVQADLNTVTGELDKLRSERAVLESSMNASMHALDNVAAGKAGKDTTDKGGKDKDAKSKDEKKYEDEFNRYFDIEKAIEDVDYAVKQLEKDQKNLHGKGLIESLQKENELIEKQTENYEKLYDLQKEEAKELIGKLKGLGLAFDDSGAITNYAEATKKALDDYNKAVAQYNVDQNDEVFEIHEKAYENFKKTLERYESLYYKEMKDTQDKIDDNNRKVLENNLKGWEVEIELRLETNKMERDWNNFLRKINKDYKKVFKDLGQEMQDLIAQTGELEKDQAVYLDELDDVTAEIDKMVAGNTSTMFENIDQAKEKLKELYDQIISNGEEIYDLQQEAWDNYLDSIDQAADKFDVIEDGWKRVNDELEFQKQLIELCYGEEAYDLMDSYYKGQESATKAEIESLKTTTDMWHQLQVESGATMDNQLDQTEDQQKYYEQQQEAQQGLNDKLIDYIKLLKDDYLNTVNKILDDVEKKIFGSGGLDAVKQQQEDIKWYSDKYLDGTKKTLAIQKLASKYNEAISKTDNLALQKKLGEERDKAVKRLKEEDRLTQYKVDYETKYLNVMEKEAALEDSKNSKNKMMLTRNEHGGWSYQYIADEENVEDKKQELLDAQTELYDLSVEQMSKTIDESLALQEEYSRRVLEIATKLNNNLITEEEANQQYDSLKADYGERLSLSGKELNGVMNDMTFAEADVIQGVQRTSGEECEALTAEQKQLITLFKDNTILDSATLRTAIEQDYQGIGTTARTVLTESGDLQKATAIDIIQKQNGDDEDSLRNQLDFAIESIKQKSIEYQDKMKEIGEVVGIVLVGEDGKDGIKGRIMDVEDEETRLGNMTKKLTNDTTVLLEEQKRNIGGIEAAQDKVTTAVGKAISEIEKYLKLQAEAGIDAKIEVKGTVTVTDDSDDTVVVGKGSGDGSNGSGSNPDNVTVNLVQGQSDISATANGQYFTRNADGSIEAHNAGGNTAMASQLEDIGHGAPSNIKRITDGLKTLGIQSFDTGGYTGNQGNDEGRLAVVHEKELILNEKDTDNLLDMINLIKYNREKMMNDFQEMEYMLHKSVAKMQTAQAINSYKDYINAIGNMAGGPVSGDTFYIDKLEFPNANSVNEIREAILTLPNIASQYVGKNGR